MRQKLKKKKKKWRANKTAKNLFEKNTYMMVSKREEKI